MNISVISHCAMDRVHLQGAVYEQAGGDACYSGLMAAEFRASVSLQTRFGPDFPKEYLKHSRIECGPEDAESERPTTKFAIHIEGRDRTLRLENECEPITVREESRDGTIVSPIYHEIGPDAIRGQDGYLLYNPQGLLREAGEGGLVRISPRRLGLEGVDALKVNPAEVQAISGAEGDEGLRLLQKAGASTILLTNGKQISMLDKTMVYSIELPNKEIFDTTGLGAIMCGAFLHTILKEKDALWALCFAGGAVQAALDTKSLGLAKVPRRGAIQTNASYFYNLVKYRQV